MMDTKIETKETIVIKGSPNAKPNEVADQVFGLLTRGGEKSVIFTVIGKVYEGKGLDVLDLLNGRSDRPGFAAFFHRPEDWVEAKRDGKIKKDWRVVSRFEIFLVDRPLT